MSITLRKMRFQLIAAAIAFTGCGAQDLADNMSERSESDVHPVDVERSELESDLLTLRNKIDVRLDELDAKLQDEVALSETEQAGLMRSRDELQDARNRIERARRDVDASRYDNWPSVRRATMTTYNEISEWLEGEAAATDTLPSGLDVEQLEDH